MFLSKVTRNFQVTIPANIRKEFHIGVGTILDFFPTKQGIVIKPKTLIDEDQSWFWNEEWQKGEKDVNIARKKGQTKSFASTKEMKKHFEKK